MGIDVCWLLQLVPEMTETGLRELFTALCQLSEAMCYSRWMQMAASTCKLRHLEDKTDTLSTLVNQEDELFWCQRTRQHIKGIHPVFIKFLLAVFFERICRKKSLFYQPKLKVWFWHKSGYSADTFSHIIISKQKWWARSLLFILYTLSISITLWKQRRFKIQCQWKLKSNFDAIRGGRKDYIAKAICIWLINSLIRYFF